MSSGCAAQTASMPSSSSMRPDLVAMLRRIQVAAVWPSSFAAFGASQGASSGTFRASRLSRRWACSTSTRTAGLMRGIVPRVAADAAPVLEQVVALGVRGERLHAELAGERGEPVLRRPDPLAAHLDDLAVADVVVEEAAAHPVAGLDTTTDRAPRAVERAGGGEPGEPRAHDDHVRLASPGRPPPEPNSLPWRVRMPPATHSAEREEERRLNTRTLTIASVASARRPPLPRSSGSPAHGSPRRSPLSWWR